MRCFQLNKLVRDGIVADMKRMGQIVNSRKLSRQEYLTCLQEKLLEEANEVDISDSATALKELADLQEVIDQIVKTLGKTTKDVEDLQKQKREKIGLFEKRLYVDTWMLEDDDPWVGYYAKEPARFVELGVEKKNS